MNKIKILAVDLSNVFRGKWEASAGRNDQGQQAFDGSLAAIADAREGFDRVAVCCDAGPSFRKVIEPAYKAHRERPPEAYGAQLSRLLGRLTADGCSIFKAPAIEVPDVPTGTFYAEADDVIASLCAWSTPHGTVRILGSDKDLLQLVDDAGVDVRKLDGAIFNEAAVLAKHGVTPARVPDWLAIGGDRSDGFKAFPGWEETDAAGEIKKRPGIGDTTAAKLLEKFGNVVGIFDALASKDDAGEPKIKGHVAEVLTRHGLAAGMRGLQLATLRHDLPIDFAPLLAEPTVKKAAEVAPYFKPELVAASPSDRSPVATAAPRAEPTTALALPTRDRSVGIDVYALQPRTLGELWNTAEALFNSRLYPQYSNAEAIMAIAIEANERGVSIGLALRNGYVVSGRPAWSASFIAGLVLASGKADIFEIIESTAARAVLEYQRKGRPSGRFEFTIEEARVAGWIKGGSKWSTNPRTMLRWAAMREAARAFFPDVVSGMHTPDELRDGQVTDAEWEVAA